jgi:hypothetical protein
MVVVAVGLMLCLRGAAEDSVLQVRRFGQTRAQLSRSDRSNGWVFRSVW